MAPRISKKKAGKSLQDKIAAASEPSEVFGEWKVSDGIDHEIWLDMQFDDLSEQVAAAPDLLVNLNHLKIRAKVNHERSKIEHNGKKFSIGFAGAAAGLVRFDSSPFAQGDRAKIYLGEPKSGRLAELRSKMALKLSNAGDTDAVTRMRSEFNILTKHLEYKKGIPTVFNGGSMKGARYGILMGNYSCYISLAELMAALGGTVSLEDCRWIFGGVYQILAHAKRCGVVHCAVLPEHILVKPETRSVVLCGWGSARLLHEKCQSRINPFLPPEVNLGGTVDYGTDLFSMAGAMVKAAAGAAATAQGMPDYYPEPLCNLMLSAFLPATFRTSLEAFWQDFNAIVDGTTETKNKK